MSPDRKIPLILLGVWNILPIGVYTWFNDVAVGQLERLTGVRLGTFCHLQNDLNYECFSQADTNELKASLSELSSEEQHQYVQKIADDYYKNVEPLEAKVDILKCADFAETNDEQLTAHIEELTDLWSHVTMQIWYAVLLDIWYPRPWDKAIIKSVIAKVRDHCGHLHAQSDKIEHALYVESGRRIGLSGRETFFLFQPELIAALRGAPIGKSIVASRQQKWVATNIDGNFAVYAAENAERMVERFVVPTIGKKKTDELKGTPASRGTARGRARVVLLNKQFGEFEEGEILVSLQTMVHFLPVMKKSVAILTEFGGLTSHAAIVSRELGKPCVVGISGLIASVKTGDLIEVDADAGIVRIL